jgi:hypothetical protein
MRNIITDNNKSEEALGSLVSAWKMEGVNIGKPQGRDEGKLEEKYQIARKLRFGYALDCEGNRVIN